MDLLEVRELRYFVAVAEELHFGRAAELIGVAQPALSKAVRRIEERLGVQLFARTSRSVALTEAGEALLESGRPALSAMAAAAQAAQRADESSPLRLALKPGGDAGLLSALLGAYGDHPGARQVDVMFHAGPERAMLVREGLADAALLYTPFEDAVGLTTTVLHVEARVAVLPAEHRLAARTSLTRADLEGETFPRWRGQPAQGVHGPEIADVAELAPLVRLGRAVAVLPRSLVTPAPQGTVSVPVVDAGSSSIALGTRPRDRREAVRALVAAARQARRPDSAS